jgi:hypothetical protein
MKKIIITLFAATFLQSALAQPQDQDRPKNPPPIKERLERVWSEFAKNKIELTSAEKEKVSDAFKTFFEGMDRLHVSRQRPDRNAVDELIKKRDESIKKSIASGTFQKYLAISKTLLPKPPGERRE